MSGPGEDRSKWRGGRPFARNAALDSRDRTAGPQGGPRGVQNTAPAGPWSSPHEQTASGSAHERSGSTKAFNLAECKAALKPVPTKQAPLKYKPTEPSGKDVAGNRASSPWGVKPNSMANGRDFFLELRKQVAVLQQGGSIPGG